MKHKLSISLNASHSGCEMNVVIDGVSFSASCKDSLMFGMLGRELSWMISAVFPLTSTGEMAENMDIIELQDTINKTMHQLERLFCRE